MYLEPQDQWLSIAVSRVRQPIESLLGWIEQQTGIKCAGKVRSYNGLMVHVFGKLAAAIFFGIIYALALNSHLSSYQSFDRIVYNSVIVT